jgi:adenosylcobinamide kinase/adenosylcobinamide-phosphate guanylyltransferase
MTGYSLCCGHAWIEEETMGIRLVTGGVRSGKSRFAESLCVKEGKPVVYLATSQVMDDEMKARVIAHQRQRPKEWEVKEEAFDLAGVIAEIPTGSVLLVDSLTAWVSNLLMSEPLAEGEDPSRWRSRRLTQVESHAHAWLDCLAARDAVIVTDEVGLGGVAMHPISRCFQDALGWVNQQVALRADEVWFVVSGVPWRVKG